MGGELWGAKTYVTWLQEFESAKCEKKTKELIEKSFPQRRNVERCKRGKSSVEQLIVFCTFQGKITARNSTKIKKWMSGKQLHAHSHTHTIQTLDLLETVGANNNLFFLSRSFSSYPHTQRQSRWIITTFYDQRADPTQNLKNQVVKVNRIKHRLVNDNKKDLRRATKAADENLKSYTEKKTKAAVERTEARK